MSAVWIKLTVLFFSSSALSKTAQSGVMWRKAEEAVKIQCQCSVKGVRSFVLFKDLNEEVKVVNRHMESRKNTIALTFKDRLKITADNSSVDIEIKNLTVDDTGVYMCMFKRLNPKNDLEQVKGNGSVLLVVTDEKQECAAKHHNLVLVSVGISAAVLLSFIFAAIVWFFLKTKTLRTAVKPQRIATNDVYEDMRSTLRR